jgi:cation-transporting P-type ATPase I
VELSPGDVVPADCRIVTCDSLEVDESVLTGESLPVGKDPAAIRGATVSDRASVLYDGTTVVNGTALAVVTATGDDSEVGRSLADAPAPPPSGVEARLRSITAVTLPVTLLSGAGVTGMSLLRGRSPRVAVRSGMSLMIAAVPEGLPIVATVAQLAAARRMSEHGAIVRNARTMEALGRVDMLCFDKTGTLTEGKIALQRVSDGSRDAIVGRLTSGQRAVLGAALRSSPDEAADGSLVHATDRAVVGGAASADVGADEGLGEWQLIDELAFEPARGYHAVVGKTPEGLRISVKGAPEVVLPRCVRWRGPEGIVEMSDRVRALLVSEVERLASLGLRVLAVAENSVPEGRRATREELGDEDVEALELLGFCGLADQVRPTASQAVGVLRSAGVDTVMITGDHPATAQAIAHELGMNDRKRVITGPEIDALDDEELQRELKDVSLFARVTPSHKVRIVRAYQKAGHVVAMTGDGANDAPAIRRAHTGIAVGKRGSPAAREAADLVIVDDRIETIVDAIVEGRAMWVSVREALAILVGGNLGEIGFTVAGTAISGASPLGPRQLLLVNLLTDMLPALAIALRQPPEHGASSLLHEGPDASLGEALARQIAMRAAVTAGGSLGAWAVARSTGTRRRASTVGLAALVGTQLGQTAVVGGKNPIVLGSTLLSAGVLIGVVQTPGVSQFFGCTPLGPFGWGIATFATVAGTSASVLLPWASRTMAGLRPETGEIRASDPTSLSKGGESPPDP